MKEQRNEGWVALIYCGLLEGSWVILCGVMSPPKPCHDYSANGCKPIK